MNTYKYKCGHEIDSDIVTMSYFNYKRKYSTFDVEPGSYNVEKKTINVFVPQKKDLVGLFDGKKIMICDNKGNPLRKATKNDNDLIKKIVIMSTVKKFRIDAFQNSKN